MVINLILKNYRMQLSLEKCDEWSTIDKEKEDDDGYAHYSKHGWPILSMSQNTGFNSGKVSSVTVQPQQEFSDIQPPLPRKTCQCLNASSTIKDAVGVVFTWVQVSEAVKSQALKVETHLELERDGLDECLSEQPAVLLSCNSADTYTGTDIRKQGPQLNTCFLIKNLSFFKAFLVSRLYLNPSQCFPSPIKNPK